MEESRRVDKWLWEVRVFKTRNQAGQACRAGRIRIAGQPVKPSRELHPGDEISVYNPLVTRTFSVTGFPKSRIGAKLVNDYLADLTPEEEYQKLKMARELNFELRNQGLGRPTKKQRRDIDFLKQVWKD
jgi:ribosome-associated heat shock protein Hsp15